MLGVPLLGSHGASPRRTSSANGRKILVPAQRRLTTRHSCLAPLNSARVPLCDARCATAWKPPYCVPPSPTALPAADKQCKSCRAATTAESLHNGPPTALEIGPATAVGSLGHTPRTFEAHDPHPSRRLQVSSALKPTVALPMPSQPRKPLPPMTNPIAHGARHPPRPLSGPSIRRPPRFGRNRDPLTNAPRAIPNPLLAQSPCLTPHTRGGYSGKRDPR